MQLIRSERANATHTRFIYSHRFRKHQSDAQKLKITVVAINEERANLKAWDHLRDLYKQLKQFKNRHAL